MPRVTQQEQSLDLNPGSVASGPPFLPAPSRAGCVISLQPGAPLGLGFLTCALDDVVRTAFVSRPGHMPSAPHRLTVLTTCSCLPLVRMGAEPPTPASRPLGGDLTRLAKGHLASPGLCRVSLTTQPEPASCLSWLSSPHRHRGLLRPGSVPAPLTRSLLRRHENVSSSGGSSLLRAAPPASASGTVPSLQELL